MAIFNSYVSLPEGTPTNIHDFCDILMSDVVFCDVLGSAIDHRTRSSMLFHLWALAFSNSGALLEQSVSSWETGSVGFIFLWNRHLDWDWCYFFDRFHQSFIWFQQWQASFPRIFVLLACWQSQTWDSTEHVPVGESAIPQYLCAPQICLTGYIHVSGSGVLPISYGPFPLLRLFSQVLYKIWTYYNIFKRYISLVTVHFFLRCLGFAAYARNGRRSCWERSRCPSWCCPARLGAPGSIDALEDN